LDWQSFVPFIPFFASFFGVLAAFLLNRLWANHKKQQTARKLIPYIYFEMKQNLQLTKECLEQNEEFHRGAKRFELSHWQMFRTAFRDLTPVPVSVLIKIYYHLMRANRLLDEGAKIRDGKVNLSANTARQLIKDQLMEFEKWFNQDKRAMKAKAEVEQQWKTIGKYDSEVRQA
jgi:hypothetical protein